jgi:hypothetical protein
VYEERHIVMVVLYRLDFQKHSFMARDPNTPSMDSTSSGKVKRPVRPSTTTTAQETPAVVRIFRVPHAQVYAKRLEEFKKAADRDKAAESRERGPVFSRIYSSMRRASYTNKGMFIQNFVLISNY